MVECAHDATRGYNIYYNEGAGGVLSPARDIPGHEVSESPACGVARPPDQFAAEGAEDHGVGAGRSHLVSRHSV